MSRVLADAMIRPAGAFSDIEAGTVSSVAAFSRAVIPHALRFENHMARCSRLKSGLWVPHHRLRSYDTLGVRREMRAFRPLPCAGVSVHDHTLIKICLSLEVTPVIFDASIRNP